MTTALGTASRVLAVLMATGVAICAQAPAQPKTGASLAITHAARDVAPGEAVLLTISAPSPLSSVTGQVFGQPLVAFPGGNPTTWYALVGIDLGTPPAAYRATVDAKAADGAALSGSHRLTVRAKAFGVRRLRVPEQFVTPPTGELARIEREQKRLTEVLSVVSSQRLWGGAFEKPTAGAPVSPFGVRSEYNGKRGNPHRGTDFAGAEGAAVRAPNAGRVVLAADLYFSGHTVILDHGLGLFSLLAHLSRVDVREGDLVARGARVGAVGATGRVTGPHLHWGVRLGRAGVDPLSLLAITKAER